MFGGGITESKPVLILYSCMVLSICAMNIFMIYTWAKVFRNPLYLSIHETGITLREFGFVHWGDIEEIGYDPLGLAFHFWLSDTADEYPNSGWDLLGNIRYSRNGDEVLAFMRTTEMLGLTCSGKRSDWRDVLLSLECYYGLWLDPTLKQEKDGVPQLDGKKLTETIRAKKDGIKFGEKYKDMVVAFNATGGEVPSP